MSFHAVPMLFDQLFNNLPALLVAICGVVLVIMHWQQHRQPATLVLVAMVLLLMVSVLHPIAITTLVTGQSRMDMQFFQLAMRALSWFSRLANCAAILLLLLAVFAGRGGDKFPSHPSGYR